MVHTISNHKKARKGTWRGTNEGLGRREKEQEVGDLRGRKCSGLWRKGGRLCQKVPIKEGKANGVGEKAGKTINLRAA